MKLFLWTDSSRKPSKRIINPAVAWPRVRCPAESSFWSYPRCVSLTSEVMCMLWPGFVWDYWCRLQSDSPRRALLHGVPALTTEGTGLQQSERSPGINRSVTAGEQNNKWPGVSPPVPSPDIYVVCGLPWETEGFQVVLHRLKTFSFNLTCGFLVCWNRGLLLLSSIISKEYGYKVIWLCNLKTEGDN